MRISPIREILAVGTDPKVCPYCKSRQGTFRCPVCNRILQDREEYPITILQDSFTPSGQE